MHTTFKPIFNQDISSADETGILIDTSYVNVIYDCAKKCKSTLGVCQMISFKGNTCKLYSQVRTSSLVASPTVPCLFQVVNPSYSGINANLVNYWLFNNNFDDIVSGFDMTPSSSGSVSFVSDRLNTPFGAVYLNRAYLRAPIGVYFNGDFSVSIWVKVYSGNSKSAKILDFDIVSQAARKEDACLAFNVYAADDGFVKWASTNNGVITQVFSNTPIKQGKWMF